MTGLIKYEAARLALAEAKSVDEVKDWIDKSAAMKAYGQMAKDKGLEVDAAEIRIRAERRLGEMIAAQKAEGGLNRGAATPSSATSALPTLADAGISHDLSARAQNYAAVPEAQFEAEVGQWKERVQQEGKRVSARLETAGRQAREGKPDNVVNIDEVAALKAEIAELKERNAELATIAEEAMAEVESLAKMVDASDQVKEALAQAKQHREMNRVLEERIRGLQSEKNEAIRAAKAWQRKAEKVA